MEDLDQTDAFTWGRLQFAPKVLCEHYYCRCMMAAELAAMDMLEAAIEVHSKRVPCRVREGE